MQKLPLSCLIIAKNAFLTLPHTLRSVEFCDQVIVGDDGSTDDTIAIARHMGADIIKLPTVSSFAQKRNALTPYAQHDWVLWVDADEWVSPLLASALQRAVFSPSSNIVGYTVQRVDTFLGKRLLHGETGHCFLLRLANKNHAIWQREVHEYMSVSGETALLSGTLEHDSHPDLESFLTKIDRYTTLEVEERVKNLKPARVRMLMTAMYGQMLFYPVAKFLFNFIIRRGIIDGLAGFVMAYMMSQHSLIVRIKVIEYLRQRTMRSL